MQISWKLIGKLIVGMKWRKTYVWNGNPRFKYTQSFSWLMCIMGKSYAFSQGSYMPADQ